MADYLDTEWNSIRIKARPVGIRGALGALPRIGGWLCRTPYMTGDHKVFKVKIWATDKALRGTTARLTHQFADSDHATPGGSKGTAEVVLARRAHTIRITTPWIEKTGQHQVIGVLALAGVAENPWKTRPLVNFDVKSSDSVYLLVAGLIASLAIGLAGAGIGAWLGSRLGQSSEPVRVIVVDEQPASQSGIDISAE